MAEDHGNDMVRRQLDTDVEKPAVQIVRTLADVEDRDPTEYTDIWGCADGVLGHLFSNPPAPEANMQITFDYEGYRISVDQFGDVAFRELQ
jgi:hypothetical protein